MAAMWSASNACRMPSVYAVTPSPMPNTPDVPTLRPWGATIPMRVPQPTTCSSSTKAVMADRTVHSVRPREIRRLGRASSMSARSAGVTVGGTDMERDYCEVLAPATGKRQRPLTCADAPSSGSGAGH